jgi:hypothetical protein
MSELILPSVVALVLLSDGARTTPDSDSLAGEFTVYEDPSHPIPGWVRDFDHLPRAVQLNKFEQLTIAQRIELAILIGDLHEPPDGTWFVEVSNMGQPVVAAVETMLPKERSDHFVIGMLTILSELRNLSCYIVIIPPTLDESFATRVSQMVEPYYRKYGMRLVEQIRKPNNCPRPGPTPR